MEKGFLDCLKDWSQRMRSLLLREDEGDEFLLGGGWGGEEQY
jgi:hypothetical protein